MDGYIYIQQHTYLYLCHNDNMTDLRAMHHWHSRAHTDYSDDPNVMGRHMFDMSTDRVQYTSDTIHGMFYTFEWANRSIANPNIPYRGRHPT